MILQLMCVRITLLSIVVAQGFMLSCKVSLVILVFASMTFLFLAVARLISIHDLNKLYNLFVFCVRQQK